MSNYSKQEVEATHARYLALRGEIETGDKPWSALADLISQWLSFSPRLEGHSDS